MRYKYRDHHHTEEIPVDGPRTDTEPLLEESSS